jgi:hypothetical protein
LAEIVIKVVVGFGVSGEAGCFWVGFGFPVLFVGEEGLPIHEERGGVDGGGLCSVASGLWFGQKVQNR